VGGEKKARVLSEYDIERAEIIGIVLSIVIERDWEQDVGGQSRSRRAAPVFIYGSGGVGLPLSDCAD